MILRILSRTWDAVRHFVRTRMSWLDLSCSV